MAIDVGRDIQRPHTDCLNSVRKLSICAAVLQGKGAQFVEIVPTTQVDLIDSKTVLFVHSGILF